MQRTISLALAMLAGAAFGAFAVTNLSAQNKAPGTYAVIDINDITDNDTFTKRLLPKTTPAMEAFGGHYVIRTDKLVAVEGVAPKRFVVLAFDLCLLRTGGP